MAHNPDFLIGRQKTLHRLFTAYARLPDHPSKIRIRNWISRKILRERLVALLNNGHLLEVDPTDWIGVQVVQEGTYEAATLALIERVMKSNPGDFVDIGANIGLHSVHAGAIPETRHIYAFEPVASNHERLLRNLQLNAMNDRATTFLLPLSSNFSLVSMAIQKSGNAGTFTVQEQGCNMLQAALPLRQVLSKYTTASLTIVKIDVEGHELDVLKGMDFEGRLRPKNLIVEWGYPDDEEKAHFLIQHSFTMHDVFGNPVDSAEALFENNAWFRDALTA